METSHDEEHGHHSEPTGRLERLWQTTFILGLLVIPVLVGISSAQRWPHLDRGFYESSAQIIATLFIAIALEFFIRATPPWSGGLERSVVLCLLGLSWAGLFASIRATIDATAGTIDIFVTTAGLMSASILVCVALFERMGPTGLVLIFLLPPVLIMVVL